VLYLVAAFVAVTLLALLAFGVLLGAVIAGVAAGLMWGLTSLGLGSIAKKHPSLPVWLATVLTGVVGFPLAGRIPNPHDRAFGYVIVMLAVSLLFFVAAVITEDT
jgi:hypothetical protein